MKLAISEEDCRITQSFTQIGQKFKLHREKENALARQHETKHRGPKKLRVARKSDFISKSRRFPELQHTVSRTLLGQRAGLPQLGGGGDGRQVSHG